MGERRHVNGPLFSDEFLRKIERLVLVARRRRGAGGAADGARGGSLEFMGHRAYAPGEDYRAVDWPLFGRLGRLYVKEYEREEEAAVVLAVDVSGSMEGKLAGALRLSAALASIALARGDSVRVAALRDGTALLSRPLSGEGRRGEALAFLEGLSGRCGGQTDLDASLRCLPPHRGQGERLLVLVSDLLAEGDGRAELSRISGDRLVLHWLSADERRPAATGLVRLSSPEGGELEVYLGSDEAELYRREMEKYLEETSAYYLRRGVRYVIVSAEQSVEETVLHLLTREGVLR